MQKTAKITEFPEKNPNFRRKNSNFYPKNCFQKGQNSRGGMAGDQILGGGIWAIPLPLFITALK